MRIFNVSFRSTQRPARPPRAHAKGFILALTLWMIALFGLGAAAINSWVSMATTNARTLRTRVDDEVALSNAKNEIMYALASRPMSNRGFVVGSDMKQSESDDPFMAHVVSDSSNFVAFDRRPYVME